VRKRDDYSKPNASKHKQVRSIYYTEQHVSIKLAEFSPYMSFENFNVLFVLYGLLFFLKCVLKIRIGELKMS
jgi:hypothetical protein